MPNALDTGTIAFDMAWGGSWPPPSTVSLIDPTQAREIPGFPIIDLRAHPDGHFSLRIARTDGSLLHGIEFQRVQFVGKGFCHICVAWQPSSVSLYSNAQPLGPYLSGRCALTIQLRSSPAPAQAASIDHPDSAKACQTWMQNRQRKFSTQPVKAGRRLKTLAEQAKDLFIASNNLESIANAIQLNQQKHLIGHLAAELRALTYWTKDNTREGSYNPLLLRMASKANLPLPVYGWKGLFDKQPPILARADF